MDFTEQPLTYPNKHCVTIATIVFQKQQVTFSETTNFNSNHGIPIATGDFLQQPLTSMAISDTN
jgi:hypothetical protein